jgi:hypothetical protein
LWLLIEEAREEPQLGYATLRGAWWCVYVLMKSTGERFSGVVVKHGEHGSDRC